ncbi:ECF RNA polymerase sigma factor SigD [Pseudonocardia ailaonensis]|uniref:ECF RNA polymerase sigma factor SigD n=1 Tax=Pseudonocardia ailaonensis TaxID=367279 RepID=A0ABN2N7X4_9PSEU
MTEQRDGPDAETVARAAAGDRRAVEAVVGEAHPFALRYCRGRIGRGLPGVTAEDLAQQVCLALLGALPRWTDRGRPFLALVHRIALNEVSDAFRAAARRPETAGLVPDRPSSEPGPEEHASLRDEVARLRPAFDRLSPAAREVLMLRVAAGLTAEETAAVVGSSPGAVRTMQHRALAAVRQEVGVVTPA